MRLRLVLLAVIGFSLASGVALASGGRIYSGGSAQVPRAMEMQITLYLQTGHRAKWDVSVDGPCKGGGYLGRGIGTGSGDGDPRLRLRDGRFVLHRNVILPNTGMGIHYWYTLTGHRTAGGFAGSFRYVEHDGIYSPQPTSCDSTLLRWTAHRYVRTW